MVRAALTLGRGPLADSSISFAETGGLVGERRQDDDEEDAREDEHAEPYRESSYGAEHRIGLGPPIRIEQHRDPRIRSLVRRGDAGSRGARCQALRVRRKDPRHDLQLCHRRYRLPWFARLPRRRLHEA
jgi:hypothetical protein